LAKYTRLVNKFLRILVSPLNWGMGHATRCVPVIRELQKHDAEILLGADGKALAFLRDYFPELESFSLPDLNMQYPANGSMALHMMRKAPEILRSARKEHLLLEKLVKDRNISGVISDNRFGLWSEQAYSVYITHQIRIKGPKGWGFSEPVLSGMHRKFWKNFDECWIPDFPGERNLSGDLGHPGRQPRNCHHIGPLSRFCRPDDPDTNPGKNGPPLLVLLSGPEPQRTVLENIILQQLKTSPGIKTLIVRGLPETAETAPPLPHVTCIPHLPDQELSRLIRTAGTVICRPGYSTLMDLACLKKNAVLVPTPGQTEQEYLANFHSKRKTFCTIRQAEFTLEKALRMARDLAPPDEPHSNSGLLAERVGKLITRLANLK
jgi:predicted glycosyltransferase